VGGEILHFVYTKALFYPLVVLPEKVGVKLKKNKLTSSVYDCTVEDVEYIYNKLSI